VAADYADPPELPVPCWYINPVSIVQVEDGRGGHGCMRFRPASVEGGCGEHTETHQPVRIGDLNANFPGADGRVKNGVNLADGAADDAVGIGVEADIRGLP